MMRMGMLLYGARGRACGLLVFWAAMVVAAAMVLAFPVAARAQVAEWTVYDPLDSGLPFDLIGVLACEEGGVVWVGTADPFGAGNGLARFDGETWAVYNTSNSGLPHNAIYALAPDGQGGIWVGTAGGVSGGGRGLAHFDGANWTVYDTSNSGLPSNGVKVLVFDDQGVLWVGTAGGLARWDGVDWQVYNRANSGLPHNNAYAIAFDEEGDMWIGTYGGGLACWDGKTWEVFDRSNSGLPYDKVYAIAIDGQGRKWIGTADHISGPVGGGLAMFDGESWTVYNTSNSPLPHNDVYAVVIDADGSVWTGSGDHIPASVGGLARFDGERWTVYDKTNSGIPYNLVYALAIDAEGAKWVGSVNFDEAGGLAVCRVRPSVDFNGDGAVDGADLLIVAGHWGEDYTYCDIGPTAFGDGVVDVQDVIVLAEYIGREVHDSTLLAHWAFDETEGAIASNSASERDGALMGGAVWEPDGGQVGGALGLDGVDGYVSTEYVLSAAGDQWSVLAWIKGGAAGEVIVSQQEGQDWLMIDPAGALMTNLKGAGRQAKALASEVTITDGRWHRVGLVRDGNSRCLYVDDVLVAEDTEGLMADLWKGLYIGCGEGGDVGTYFTGSIDEVRIYERAVRP